MRRTRCLRWLTAATALLALSFSAVADDYYVDAWNGDDLNGGTGVGDAWRTVTHALTVVPDPTAGGVHVIHLAPAIYDAWSGETYPLVMRPDIQLVGDGGPIGVILQGMGTGTLLSFESLQSGLGESFDADSLVRGLTLERAGTAIGIGTDWGTIAPRFEDLLITDMSGNAVSVSGGSILFPGAGNFDPVFERVTVWDCANDMSVASYGSGSSSVTLNDCVLRDGPGRGIDISISDQGSVDLLARRVVIRNHSGDQIHVRYTNFGSVGVTLEHCELAQGAGDGIEVESDLGLGGFANLRLRHCTVTEHAGVGLSIAKDPSSSFANHPTELESTILYGNADDLLETSWDPSVTLIRRCDIGDGDYLGVAGTFSADPLFVAPQFSDYRLRFGSPCIDTGEQGSLAAGEASLGGIVPPVDGDLDLLKEHDVGAREFAPLQLGGVPRLGQTVRLECWGPPSGLSKIYWSRGLPMTQPRVLPFGEYWLRGRPIHWETVATAPDLPGISLVRIPLDVRLVGRSFSFQAYASTPAGSSLPAVLTEPVVVTVVP